LTGVGVEGVAMEGKVVGEGEWQVDGRGRGDGGSNVGLAGARATILGGKVTHSGCTLFFVEKNA
jgi:hypothetical protein